MSTALRETIKSAVRGIYFALLGIVVLVLTVVAGSPEVAKATVTIPTLNITLSVGAIIVAAVAAAAKLIDRYIHKADTISANGIAPSFLQTPTLATVTPITVAPTKAVPAYTPPQPPANLGS